MEIRWYREPFVLNEGLFLNGGLIVKEMNKTYNPQEFEDGIYNSWMEGDYFKADNESEKPSFSIVMPPPNVTGNLHLGHAINNTIQDILIRWKRMSGFETLWVPGTDHASISTEARVVNKIKSEGKTKESLGREGFLKEAWDWTNTYGGNIENQLKRLGVSCDWSRKRFTLDDQLSKAVETVFVKLYKDNLIYQGDRIVNWCPSCQTAVSDAEVDHEEALGKIYYIRYPLTDGKESIVVATTRPETMLGDLAVAVNPNDERYQEFIGKNLTLPLVDRSIPVIADEYVSSEFGTGAVKITPSHDPNDFEVGERHQLGQCIVINLDATIADGYEPYSGLDRYVARKQIVEDLDKMGLLVKIEDHENSIGHCERCKTVIEPIISKQWFVKMNELAQPAIRAIENKEIQLIPDRFEKIYLNWLYNIRDWCVSRQLWWGHRLPVYYCDDCLQVTVSSEATQCEHCHSGNIHRDEDTLDTWFSSALWPFSTLGWPDQTKDFTKFFPTDVLATGYDIIFFWVIRMVFSSLYNTGEVPFKYVYFNGLVRDAQGRKMSKSLDNGIDPIDVIDEYGADALRFTLVTGNTPGNDMRFYNEKVEANRNFANKIWNASRFVLMNYDESLEFSLEDLRIEDRWIMTRLAKTTQAMEKNLSRFEFGLAAQEIYNFSWNEFCDWYIELSKNRLYSEDSTSKQTAQSVLITVLTYVLKLMHPFMPFITEEIYKSMPTKKDMLINDSWPSVDDFELYEEDEKQMEMAIEMITAIRNARAEMNIPPSKKAELIISTDHNDVKNLMSQINIHLDSLASTHSVRIEPADYHLEESLQVIKSNYKLFIPLRGLIDYEKEMDRQAKELEKIRGEIQRAKSKLNNESFVNKAPEAVVEVERDKLQKYLHLEKELKENLDDLVKKNNEL